MISRHLAQRVWEEVTAKAGDLGPLLSSARWVGPPESDELRAKWFPSFPASVGHELIGTASDVENFNPKIEEALSGCDTDDEIACFFSDPMWGVIYLDIEVIRSSGNAAKLAILDGDSFVFSPEEDLAFLVDVDEAESDRKLSLFRLDPVSG